MAVSETLALDVRQALANIGELDRKLTQTTAKFETGLATATRQLDVRATTTGVDQATTAVRGLGTEVETAGKKEEIAKRSADSHRESLRAMGTEAQIAGAILVGAFGLAVTAAVKLEDALIPINTLLGASSEQAQVLSASLTEIIATSPQSAEEIGLSAYTILSAGITDTATVLETLRASQQLAEAGLGTLAEATGIVTSAINSFQGEGLSANKAAELFFGTIASGKTTTAGLAQGFGQIAPLAAGVGVSFRDLLAATAALTATGQEASVAYTGLRGVFTNVLKPSLDASAAAKKLGIDFSASRLAAVGLAQFLREVQEAAGGNVETLSALFGSVEGLNAVIALTGPQAKAFSANLANIDESGAKLGKRAAEVEQSLGNVFKTLQNQVSVTLAQAIKPALPIIRALLDGVGSLAEGFAHLPAPVQVGLQGLVLFTGTSLLLFGTFTKLIAGFQTAGDFLRSFGSEASKASGSITLADRATTGLANNLGLVARGAVGLGAFFAIGPQLESLTGDFTTAGAAAGALVGTFIEPGVGTLIGALLGTIAGDIGLLGSNAQDAAERMKGLAAEIEGLGEAQAAQKFIEDFDKAVSGLGKNQALVVFFDNFKALANQSPALAARVLEGLRQLQNQGAKPIVPPEVFAALQTQLDISTKKFAEHAKNASAASGKDAALAAALTDVAGGMAGVADETKTADDVLKDYNDTLDDLFGRFTGSEQAFNDFVGGLADLTKKLKENGNTLDANTEKGLENRDALIDIVELAERHASAVLRQTGSVDAANKVLSDNITILTDTAIAAGLSDDAALDYTATLLGIPPERRTEIKNSADLARVATELLLAKYREVPPVVATTVLLSGVEVTLAQLAEIRRQMDLINQAGGSFGLFRGGVQGGGQVKPAASGAQTFLGSGSFLVGEQGFELFRPTVPGFITPHPASVGLSANAQVEPIIVNSGPLVGTLIVEAPTPNPVDVGIETARRLRAEMYLRA